MCRSMVDIQSAAAEIRRGIKKRKKKIERKKERKKLQGKNIMAPLLHRAAIIKTYKNSPDVRDAVCELFFRGPVVEIIAARLVDVNRPRINIVAVQDHS